jgi:hypothetical protein
VNGTWDNARARPDGRHGLDELDWVSCATAGNCSAAGYYRDSSLSAMAAVIGEHNGKWGKLMPVRGLGPGAAGTTSEVNSVSCGATGDCTAGGYVSGNFHGGPQAWDSFLVTERNGTWGKAHPVTGIPHGTKVSPSEVLCHRGKLLGRRLLRPQQQWECGGIRAQRAQRKVGQGDGCTRPEPAGFLRCPGELGVVPGGCPVHGRRGLFQPGRAGAGVRRRPEVTAGLNRARRG